MTAIRSIAWILLLAFTSSLIACGGSSSGKDQQPKPEPEPDTKPKSFQFPNIEDAEPGKAVTSKTVTITGIDTNVRVEVDKGQYAINDGDFTNKASTLSDGDKLTLKLKASNELVTQRTATVTVGEGSATFTVTTLQDTEAPKASFLFPPPMSATDREKLTIRGTVTDDYSDIESMTLTAYVDNQAIPLEVETHDNYANWSATLDVMDGAEHRLVVSTEDSLSNVEENAASVTVHEQAFGEPFPDNENVVEFAGGMTFDGERSRVLVSDLRSKAIIAIDMATGIRSVLSGEEHVDDSDLIRSPFGLVLHPTEEKLLVAKSNDQIVSVDLESGKREIFNSGRFPDSEEPSLQAPMAFALDPHNDSSVFVTSASNVSRLNLPTQKRTVLLESGETPFGHEGLLFDPERRRLLISDNQYRKALVSLNTESGQVSIVSDDQTPNNVNSFVCPYGLASENLSSRVLVGDCALGIVSVDLESGERTVLMDRRSPDSGGNPLYLYAEEGWSYVLFADSPNQGLYALDLKTRENVTISQGNLPDDW